MVDRFFSKKILTMQRRSAILLRVAARRRAGTGSIPTPVPNGLTNMETTLDFGLVHAQSRNGHPVQDAKGGAAYTAATDGPYRSKRSQQRTKNLGSQFSLFSHVQFGNRKVWDGGTPSLPRKMFGARGTRPSEWIVKGFAEPRPTVFQLTYVRLKPLIS